MTRSCRKRKTNNEKRHAYASGGKKLKMNDARLPKAKVDDKKRRAYASGGKMLKMNDAWQPDAKSRRQKTTCVGVRRQKAENELHMAAGSEKSTTKNAMRTRQAAKS